MPSRRRLPTLCAVGVASALLMGALGAGIPVAADDSDSAAARAQRAIAAAQQRANDAAADLLTTELKLQDLEDEVEELRVERDRLAAAVAELRGQVEHVVVSDFVGATGERVMLASPRSANDRIVRSEYAAAATQTSSSALDDFAARQQDLVEAEAALAAKEDELERQRQSFRAAQAQAEAEVVHLEQVERERQEAERRRREEQARQAELQRQREQAAAAASNSGGGGGSSNAPLPRVPALNDDDDGSSSSSGGSSSSGSGGTSNGSGSNGSGSNGSDSGSSGSGNSSGGSSGGSSSSSGGSSGGGSGGGGSGGSGSGDGGGGGGGKGSNLVCPVRGSKSYTDTWGSARSGGRSHQGVDLISSAGTPLVAVESGSVQFKQTPLGGNSVWLNGNSGTRYFYAHLSEFEGSSRSVSQGEVIGYVGATGNANGTNHLHWEVHPGGGAAVNPYPYARGAGC